MIIIFSILSNTFVFLPAGFLLLYLILSSICIDVYYKKTKFEKKDRKIEEELLYIITISPVLFIVGFFYIFLSKEIAILGFYLIFIGSVIGLGFTIEYYHNKKRKKAYEDIYKKEFFIKDRVELS
ncbi:MAG: hypothetical protein ACFE9Z_00115 [Promethearchaeota archaeon]